jgi:hypothetical protein
LRQIDRQAPRRSSCLILAESSMLETLLPRPGSVSPPSRIGELTRVPYWVYRDEALARTEQDRIFEGPVWNYLCLEDEIANPGDWRATIVGRMPVVVARDNSGSIAAFENRCAHRGALICLDNAPKIFSAFTMPGAMTFAATCSPSRSSAG